MIPTLIRREFWEHRNTFFPYVTVGLLVLVMLSVFAVGSANVSIDDPGELTKLDVSFMQYGVDLFRDMSLEDRRSVMGMAYGFIAIVFSFFLTFSIF